MPLAADQNSINLSCMGDSDRRKHDVQLHHRESGDLGAGTLHFGGNELAYVSFRAGFPAALSERSPIDIVRAVTDDGITFSLCD